LELPIKEVINRYRRNILIHSCIYYRLNESVISDYEYDRWCNRLVELQKEHPKVAANCDWNEAFKDFTGETGFDLPLGHPWVLEKAHYVLKLAKERRK
jgi:hypothetical protein